MRRKGRKGITPVIAIVLLLMMTVAAAGLAYTFLVGVQSEAQAGVEMQVAAQRQASEAMLSIDTVAKMDNATMITIRNSGSFVFENVTAFKVYVDGKPTEANLTGGLAPGETLDVNLTTVDWQDQLGAEMEIRVVPPIGMEAKYICKIKKAGDEYC